MKIPEDFELAYKLPFTIFLIILGIGIFYKSSVLIGISLPFLLVVWVLRDW